MDYRIYVRITEWEMTAEQSRQLEVELATLCRLQAQQARTVIQVDSLEEANAVFILPSGRRPADIADSRDHALWHLADRARSRGVPVCFIGPDSKVFKVARAKCENSDEPCVIEFFLPVARCRGCNSGDDVKALVEVLVIQEAITRGYLPEGVTGCADGIAMEVNQVREPGNRGYDVTAYLDRQWLQEQLEISEREFQDRIGRREKRRSISPEQYASLKKRGLSSCCRAQVFSVEVRRKVFHVHCSECRDYLWLIGPKYMTPTVQDLAFD